MELKKRIIFDEIRRERIKFAIFFEENLEVQGCTLGIFAEKWKNLMQKLIYLREKIFEG